MLTISSKISISDNEIEIKAIRSRGPGGQNVNKVSSAIHLRFDIKSSSLPDFYKERLLNLKDSRITRDGIIIIKAMQYRSQEKNREDAFIRLQELIRGAARTHRKRKPTRPSQSARKKRLNTKAKRGRIKTLRKRVTGNDIGII